MLPISLSVCHWQAFLAQSRAYPSRASLLWCVNNYGRKNFYSPGQEYCFAFFDHLPFGRLTSDQLSYHFWFPFFWHEHKKHLNLHNTFDQQMSFHKNVFMVGICDIDFFKLSPLPTTKFWNFESVQMGLKFCRQLLKAPKEKFYGIPKVYIFHRVFFHFSSNVP